MVQSGAEIMPRRSLIFSGAGDARFGVWRGTAVDAPCAWGGCGWPHVLIRDSGFLLSVIAQFTVLGWPSALETLNRQGMTVGNEWDRRGPRLLFQSIRWEAPSNPPHKINPSLFEVDICIKWRPYALLPDQGPGLRMSGMLRRASLDGEMAADRSSLRCLS